MPSAFVSIPVVPKKKPAFRENKDFFNRDPPQKIEMFKNADFSLIELMK